MGTVGEVRFRFVRGDIFPESGREAVYVHSPSSQGLGDDHSLGGGRRVVGPHLVAGKTQNSDAGISNARRVNRLVKFLHV